MKKAHFFEVLSPEEEAQMSKADIRAFRTKNSFKALLPEEQDDYKLDLRLVEKVLSSSRLIMDIPDYVNGRSTAVNAELIKVSLWIWDKQFIELEEIHMAFQCYETALK